MKDWQPEVFAENATWGTLFEAAEEVFDSLIKEPTIEMEEIRNITKETDPFIISQTIKQLGFDLPLDLIAGNEQRLATAIYLLPLFFETAGTNDFVRPIEFILGRTVDVRQLYTDDYKNFHSSPMGALLQDGGEWYKTTHIDLAMEALPTDNNLLLSEQETIATRLMDAFYEFAPIELVVNEFRRLLVIHGNLGLMGEVNVWPQRRIIAGEGHCEPIGIRIIGPDVVNSFEKHQFKVEVYFSAIEVTDMSPVFGYSNTRINTGNEIDALLAETMPDWEDQVFNIEPRADEWAYFAMPTTLGLIDFYDVSNGFRGGWDGATWIEDGFEGSGPLIVRRTINGQSSDWYLYRTDFSGLRKSSWRIERHSDVVTVPDPIYVQTPPIYKIGPWGLKTAADLETFTETVPDTPRSLLLPAMTVNEDQFIYFAIPRDAGEVNFYRTADNTPGNFDGVTWPENDISNTTGPIIIQRTVHGMQQEWLLYRSDFTAVQDEFFIEWESEIPEIPTNVPQTFTALAGDRIVPLTPYYFTGPWGITTTQQLLEVDKQALTGANPVMINVDVLDGTFGYFLIPASTYNHSFLDQSSGLSGGWDGADWPLDDIGNNGTLFPVVMPVEGVDADWLLFRTDFSGVPDTDFEVSYSGELGSVTVITTDPNPEPEPEPEPVPPVVIPEGRCKSRIEFAHEWASNKQGVIGFEVQGVAAIADQTAETDVVVQATHLGFTNSKTVTVVPLNKGEMQDISIQGPTEMLGGESVFFMATGHFSRGATQTVYPQWSRTNPVIEIDQQGKVTAASSTEDKEVYVTAKSMSHSGVELVASRKLLIKAALADVYPVALTVTGPTSILEGHSGTFTATATMSDNTQREVVPLWRLHTQEAQIDNQGVVTFDTISDHTEVRVSASYSLHGKTVEDDYRFLLEQLRYDILNIEILGPVSVLEETTTQFSCIATWDQVKEDGTNIRTYVSAEWKSTMFEVSEYGAFITGALDSPREAILTAIVAKPNGGFLSVNKSVLVNNLALAVDYIRIQGPESVREGLTSKYTAYAKFNDGTERSILPSWSIQNSPPYASIDNNGNVTFDNNHNANQVGIIEIKASYDYGLQRLEDGLPAVLTPHIDTLQKLDIFYVEANADDVYEVQLDPEVEVEEGRRIRLLAKATYIIDDSDPDNLVTEVRDISPKWSLVNADPQNVSEVPATIIPSAGLGVVQGRNITQDTAVWVEASYFSQTARFKVIVVDYVPEPTDPVLQSWIDGPSIVHGGEIGSYAQYCVFGQGVEMIPSTAVAVSSVWSLDVDSTVAIVDDNGYLTSNVTETTRVRLTSVYTCDTETVSREIVIDLVPSENDFKNLAIIGPDVIIENTQIPFIAELERDDGTVSTVNAVWKITPQVVGVQALPPGVIFATDMTEDTTINLIAEYTEERSTIKAEKQILVSKLRAAWGVGAHGIDTAEEMLSIGTLLPNLTEDFEFEFEAGVGEYGYFLTPVSAGTVTITEVLTGFTDAWNGASWPINGIGDNGPIVVTRVFNEQQQDWYVYRTNFAQLRSTRWKVTFDNS